MLGGAAIWLSVTIAYLVFIRNATPHSTYGYIVINAGTFLFLVGLADDLVHTKPWPLLVDWTPAAACEQMVAGAHGRSARTTIIVYPGAHHDFDHPNLPLRQRTGLASSADGSGRVHAGTDPAARADAIRRVPEWLKR